MKKFHFPILLKVILAGLLVSFVASTVAIWISYNNQVKTAKETMENNIKNSISNLDDYYNTPYNVTCLDTAKSHVKNLYDARVEDGTEYELNDPRFHNNFNEFEDYYKKLDGEIYDNGFGFYPGKAEFQSKYNTMTSALVSTKISSDTVATYCAYPDGERRIVFLGDSRQIEYNAVENPPFYHLAGTFYEFGQDEEVPTFSKDNIKTVKIYGKTCKVFPIFTEDSEAEFIAYFFIEFNEDAVVARAKRIMNSEMLVLGITAAVIILIYALISYFLFVKNINKLSKASHKISRKLMGKTLGEPVLINVKSHDEMQTLASSLEALQTAVFNYAELVKEEARERERINAELEVASKIQLEALPPSTFADEKVSLNAYIKTAKEVGGDFYDYFYIDESRFVVLIADVSGKGIPAALFMMRSKAIIKNVILSHDSLEEAIYKANNILVSNNQENLFVTAFIGVIDLSKNKMTFINAGHEKPYIISKGKIHKLDGCSNFVIGEIENFKYKVEETSFNKEDILFTFTDGLNESINQEQEEFGYHRIEKTLSSKEDWSLNDLVEVLNQRHQEFIGKEVQFDDITMMAVKWNSNKLHLSFKTKDYSIIEEATNKFFEEYSYLDETTKSHVGIVLDELLNNQISYEKRQDLKIDLDFSYVDQKLQLVLTSNGEDFNPFTNNNNDSKIGGHGINIVKNLSKKQKYTYHNNQSIITVIF